MSKKSPDADSPGAWQELKGDGGEERGWAPRLIVAGLALLLGAIFVAQNSERVETTFIFFDRTPRLYMVILVSMVLGALLGQIVPALFRRRRSKEKETRAGT